MEDHATKNRQPKAQDYQSQIDGIITSLLTANTAAWAAEDLCALFSRMPNYMVSRQLRYLSKNHDVTINGQNAKSKSKKAFDLDYWLRLLRKKLRHHQEQQSRQQSNFSICSQRAIDEKQASDEAQQSFLRRQGYLNASGEPIKVSVTKKWQSKHAETLARCMGIKQQAEALDLKPMMVTITCPGRFHVNSEHYDGSTPPNANKFLNKQWNLFRNQFSDNGLEIRFIRSVEPHDDSTPHWHMIIWTNNKRLTAKLLNRYFVDIDEPFEKGQSKRLRISPVSHNSIYYLIKQYQMKGKDGNLNSVSERIRAWANTWSIRTFHTSKSDVTVYRQCRRQAMALPREARLLQQACINADYAAFLSINSQLNVKASYKTSINSYGETVHQLNGLSFNNTLYQAIQGGSQLNDITVKVTLRIKDPSNADFRIYQKQQYLKLLLNMVIRPIKISLSHRINQYQCRGPPSKRLKHSVLSVNEIIH